jgi:predicted molibdopterin-dependent oxidoreductase YjgC
MEKRKFNQSFTKMFTLITLCVLAFGFTTKMGLDSYEIYLNNNLILKQYVNQPLSLRILQLNKAKETDQLRIKYTHCMNKGAGTGRSIVLKDEKGNTLKKWAFADATGSDLNMTIAVKELLQMERTHVNHQLSLNYLARELPKGETLALIRR